MEEDEFRSTYHEINSVRCVFEKALNNRRCACQQSQHFLLAGREGRNCRSSDRQKRCHHYLDLLRQNSRFALGVTQPDGPLPHNKELRIQVGGLEGLQTQFLPEDTQPIETADIDDILSRAEQHFGSLDKLPFSLLLPKILAFKGRQKARSR